MDMRLWAPHRLNFIRVNADLIQLQYCLVVHHHSLHILLLLDTFVLFLLISSHLLQIFHHRNGRNKLGILFILLLLFQDLKLILELRLYLLLLRFSLLQNLVNILNGVLPPALFILLICVRLHHLREPVNNSLKYVKIVLLIGRIIEHLPPWDTQPPHQPCLINHLISYPLNI